MPSTPHFLLYCESSQTCAAPQWKFVLKSVDGDEHFSASDCESDLSAGRLELLAVVRGLEAIERPSRVTLLTRSRYVRRGIRREINHWRERGWRWERFGQLVPIRDCDLWQRIDRALSYHQVECWGSQTDIEAGTSSLPESCRAEEAKSWSIAATLGTLGRSVLTPLSTLWGPPFTRAA